MAAKWVAASPSTRVFSWWDQPPVRSEATRAGVLRSPSKVGMLNRLEDKFHLASPKRKGEIKALAGDLYIHPFVLSRETYEVLAEHNEMLEHLGAKPQLAAWGPWPLKNIHQHEKERELRKAKKKINPPTLTKRRLISNRIVKQDAAPPLKHSFNTRGHAMVTRE